MNQPLDQTQDINGASRHKLAQLLEFPEFVKTAGMGENVVGDSDTLPQHLYADSAKRLLPCHTKAATWLSTAYFVNSGESRYSAGTREKLASYARYWGITGVEAQLRDQLEKRAAASPESLPDSEFAVVYGDGATKTRKYPLRNAAEVATASGWFRKYAAELTFDDKHTVALKLREKIANHDVTVPEEEIDLLTRCAGLGHCDADSARSIWQKRASLLRPSNPDAADAAEEVAEAVTVASFDVRDVDTRLKMASLLDSFDRMYGLSKWYGEDGGLTPPEEALFFVTEKRAQSMVNGIVKTTTGRLYEKKALYFIIQLHLKLKLHL